MDVDQTSAEDTRPTKRARGVPSYLRLASTSTTTPSTPLTIAGRLTAIARLQQFDGQFHMSQSLLDLLEITYPLQEVRMKLNTVVPDMHENVCATILAWVWMDEKAKGREGDVEDEIGDEVLGLNEKAREWVESQLEGKGKGSFFDVKEKVLHAMAG
ncbi:hypothetical protein FB446DRAFT_757351 [Lentinula raphanica]|nr:hypothetical protein FB446DRAFT_757351 [Lentinula raphanica]